MRNNDYLLPILLTGSINSFMLNNNAFSIVKALVLAEENKRNLLVALIHTDETKASVSVLGEAFKQINEEVFGYLHSEFSVMEGELKVDLINAKSGPLQHGKLSEADQTFNGIYSYLNGKTRPLSGNTSLLINDMSTMVPQGVDRLLNFPFGQTNLFENTNSILNTGDKLEAFELSDRMGAVNQIWLNAHREIVSIELGMGPKAKTKK